MKSNSPNRNILNQQTVLALLSIALMILIGRQLPLTPGRSLAVVIVFGVVAFFLIKRKIFDARVAFALCGIGMALVFRNLGPVLRQTLEWHRSFLAIIASFGFAALMVSEGFVKELASITADFKVGNRSSVFALFLTSMIAFIVNAVIMSAGSSCAVVAPIFVPLLLRLRFPAPVAAAAVVIGAWGGFLNPADVGGSAIASAFESNDLNMYSIPARHIVPAILALVVANVTLAVMNRKKNLDEQPIESIIDRGEVPRKGTDRVRCLITILPFLLLIPVEFLAWSLEWQDKVKVEYRLLICLVGATVAAFVVVLRDSGQDERKANRIGKVYLGGMWKGLAEVVVLIMAAKLFVSPFRGIIVEYGKGAIQATPMLAFVSVPTAFLASAMIGSGDAIISSIMTTVVPIIKALPIHPGMIASMLWLATEIGRSVSPISAATLTCARAVTSEEVDGTTVARHVLRPLLVGFVVGCLALYVVFKVFK
jgi:C4-dicarboxylate transporter, DcuC family